MAASGSNGAPLPPDDDDGPEIIMPAVITAFRSVTGVPSGSPGLARALSFTPTPVKEEKKIVAWQLVKFFLISYLLRFWCLVSMAIYLCKACSLSSNACCRNPPPVVGQTA